MKVAVIGSRGLTIDNLGDYLPSETTMVISGGARGIDNCAREYAQAHKVPIREIKPDYARYKKKYAPPAQPAHYRRGRPGAGHLGRAVLWHGGGD